MDYRESVRLKDGRTCLLRTGVEEDGQAMFDLFAVTHSETDFLLTYADERTFTVQDQAAYLKERSESSREIEVLAEVDGQIVGSAGIGMLDANKEKLRHRAEFGISVAREWWGLGIGRALTRACIACAKRAGFRQLELEVVAQNATAISLYQSEGFVEWGLNPRGFLARSGDWQELVLMRLELD